MNQKIPYPEITLTSCAEDNMLLLKILSPDVCEKYVKETLLEQFTNLAMHKGAKYQTGSKKFYVVPNYAYADAVNIYNLTTPEYAAIWLPAIELHIDEIRSIIPGEEPIIAWSGDDSIFTNQKFVLGVDLSMGEVQLRFFQIRSHAVADLDPQWQILMVPNETES